MKLENSRYEVTFTNKGGEILSFTDKETNLQYMYQGDTEYWGGKNPTLFPIVGNTFSGTYTIDGKEYSMKNHGLIRYSELECVKNDGKSVVFELKANEETLSQYPFDFTYQVEYTLVDNKLNIVYTIKNNGKEEMPFNFGLHPGFNCPLEEGETFEDYKIVFDEEEQMQQLVFDVTREKAHEYQNVTLKELPCDYALYEKYATIIYKGFKSDYVTLVGPKHSVRVSQKGFPYVAFWTSKAGAPFVCLEPWFGHSDFEETGKDFYHREGTMILQSEDVFVTSYSIEIQ